MLWILVKKQLSEVSLTKPKSVNMVSIIVMVIGLAVMLLSFVLGFLCHSNGRNSRRNVHIPVFRALCTSHSDGHGMDVLSDNERSGNLFGGFRKRVQYLCWSVSGKRQ